MLSSTNEVDRAPLRRWLGRAGGHDTERSLARQSALMGAVCLVVDAVSYLTRGPGPGLWSTLVLIGILIADATLVSSPRLSGWVALGHAVLMPALAFVLLPGPSASTAGQLVSAYRAGAWLRGWPAAAALAALCGGFLGSLLISGLDGPASVLSLVAANALMPWLVGRYTTARKAHVDELRHQREAALRDAQAEVAAAVAEERETIAVELHDVISHHVSAIGVHATAARLNLAAGPLTDDRAVRTSLTAVEESSQAAMVDLRRLLSLLHEGDESPEQPGLSMLPDLLDGVRSSGLKVTHVVYNTPHPLPRAIDTTLYRVAQEMMTNALRHGDGKAARVELDYGGDRVGLTTRNPIVSGADPVGTDSPVTGFGVGLEGMRKRAETLGGSAAFGLVGDGLYWESSVTIPLGGES
ncbi:histidine kinase [Amycolatopsis sp. SID8362]|uniref:sensor histidine kinase n=1 Tax=Amycolatopsis sp. SID8362 TaxID=2690346 RepID=UPI001369F7CB|nr:histidine kinase [Amycolatopsis sp. SID8362]NBH12146.1 two-component sensor histidine kinase [Amycolatopsis sp. SID8362]NED48838.1 two-component sensor histidine kinase [Amycolatopsis sp. SID8362]